ncbi:leucine-rich glioma-inactivated protein 1-like [Uloborus diversus]|uniref:leucine-rich glioma-inactivated protein 1-like n=1 Tax=Uloborus diversus TaxID=327109 RepID=UPI00240A6339|nr:leucine-rich glioma-inactivated protein 1-like [Uloborus diversus]
MFTEMPNILAIMLKNNRFLTLEEKTFSLVWEQLQNFDASGNSLRCDCRISWIVGKRFPKATVASCAEPPTLKGKKLETLLSKDLWCL